MYSSVPGDSSAHLPDTTRCGQRGCHVTLAALAKRSLLRERQKAKFGMLRDWAEGNLVHADGGNLEQQPSIFLSRIVNIRIQLIDSVLPLGIVQALRHLAGSFSITSPAWESLLSPETGQL